MPLHALFQVTPLPEHIPPVIPQDVQKASIALIGLCIEHTALLAGREIKDGAITPPMHNPSQQPTSQPEGDNKLQQLVLTYPGKYVNSSKIVNLSRFRRDGGKQKVLMVFAALENKNLGQTHPTKHKVSPYNMLDMNNVLMEVCMIPSNEFTLAILLFFNVCYIFL